MVPGRGILGVVLLALGGLLLAERAGAVDAAALIAAWWPIVLLAAGAAAALGRPRNLELAALLSALGAVLLLVTAAGIDAGLVWPLVLVAGGAWLLLRGGASRARVVDEDAVDIVALFSGRTIRSAGGRFRGGTVTAMFGGVELDLRDAGLEDGAVLRLNAAFGGIDITVPPTWRVRMSGPAVFGGYENHAEHGATPGMPTLYVPVLVLFGGAEVRMAAPRPAEGALPA